MIEEGTFILIYFNIESLKEVAEEAQQMLKRCSVKGSKLKAVIKLNDSTYRVVYEFETSN